MTDQNDLPKLTAAVIDGYKYRCLEGSLTDTSQPVKKATPVASTQGPRDFALP